MEHRSKVIASLITLIEQGILIDTEGDMKLVAAFPEPDQKVFREGLTATKHLSGKLKEIDFKLIPSTPLVQFNEAFNDLMGMLVQMHQAFGRNDNALKNHLDTFRVQFDRFLTLSISLLTINDKLADPRNFESESKAKSEAIQKILENAQEKIEIIDKFATQAGVSTYANIFSSLANKQKTNAGFWLFFSIATIGLTIGSAIALLSMQANGNLSNVDVVQFTVTKVIVATCLFLLIAICTKNYRAQRHNQMVNQHRSNALITFDALVKTQTDEATKNAIILSVTNTIFGNQATGFNTQDNTSVEMFYKLLDKLKV